MTSQDRPALEIEITREMRTAGADVIYEHAESYPDFLLAAAVYTAMEQARRDSMKGSAEEVRGSRASRHQAKG